MTRSTHLVLLAWLITALAGVITLLALERSRLHAAFDTDARILHRELSQTLAQHEALISAADTLDRQGVSGPTLSAFTTTLLRPYPQVTAAQRCVHGRCHLLGRAARPVPDLTPRPPGPLRVEWPAAPGPLYALSLGQIRLWVNAAGLQRTGAASGAPLRVRLLRPGTGEPITADPAAWQDVRWPGFSVRKTLGSAAQNFPVQIERPVPPGAWPWAALAAWVSATGALAWSAARLTASRTQARRAAADERARAQGVVQAATEGIVALDEAGRVTLANPAARAILRHPLPAGTPVRRAAAFRATLSQAPFDAERFWHAAQATALPEGLALIRPGGDVLVEGTLAPLRASDGAQRGRVLLLREVGPLQRRMLEQLETGERRIREHEAALAHVTRLSTLGEMSAGLAHELNQPLTAIISYGQAAERLLSGPGDADSRVRHAVRGMVTQAQRAADIIVRLRQLVRRAPTQEATVDLTQATQNILTLCHADLSRLGVTVHADFPPRAALVQADPVALEQVILNLTRNALDALSGAPRRALHLRVTPLPGAWALQVRDSGPGLPDALLPELFTPFRTTKPQGLGLGLSLSQTLTQGMGGTLSGGNDPGGGAAFTLTLPGAAREAADD